MDRVTIQALYEQYAYAVHGRCLRILGSVSDAEDAVQEVFIRVMKYGGARNSEAYLPWLYAIASRVCFDRLRRRTSSEAPTDVERQQAAEDAARGAHLSPEDIRTIGQILESCNDAVREVAVLYHFDQLTQEEVAAQVGVSRKTVKKRLAQFMALARKQFGVVGLAPAEEMS